jgi:glycosyltransferase involved in cell wall biosynthesis
MEKLNILFITSYDVSPLHGGIDRVVILLAEELKKLPQCQVFSAYFHAKHKSTDIFKKKLKIDEKNIASELSDFVRENEINIILNNISNPKKFKLLLLALQQVSKQEHACKVLFHYHNDIEKYVAQLAWLMQHDKERQIMACNAVESSKRFHLSEIGKQWIKLLKETL